MVDSNPPLYTTPVVMANKLGAENSAEFYLNIAYGTIGERLSLTDVPKWFFVMSQHSDYRYRMIEFIETYGSVDKQHQFTSFHDITMDLLSDAYINECCESSRSAQLSYMLMHMKADYEMEEDKG